MAARAKQTPARKAQLRGKRVARRRHRERRAEAPADLKRLGKGETEKRRRRRYGAQQLRHDRRRRRGQANRDPGQRSPSGWVGMWPAGGEPRRNT
jgi:hypothetical protein